jgi:hypothetical protein
MFLQSVYKQNQTGTREEGIQDTETAGSDDRLKYPFFTQQNTSAFLAGVRNNSHIKKFQSSLMFITYIIRRVETKNMH